MAKTAAPKKSAQPKATNVSLTPASELEKGTVSIELPAGLTEEDFGPGGSQPKETEHYQEWKCEAQVTIDPNDRKKTIRTFERLKLIRSEVKIHKREADTLNWGRVGGASNGEIIVLYFLPSEIAAEEEGQ